MDAWFLQTCLFNCFFSAALESPQLHFDETLLYGANFEVIKGLRTDIANFLQFIEYHSALFWLTKTMSQSFTDSEENCRAVWILTTLLRKFLEMRYTHVVQ